MQGSCLVASPIAKEDTRYAPDVTSTIPCLNDRLYSSYSIMMGLINFHTIGDPFDRIPLDSNIRKPRPRLLYMTA